MTDTHCQICHGVQVLNYSPHHYHPIRICQCGGVPALIAERDQLRKLLKHTFSLWVTGAPTSKNTQTRDEILAAIMQKPLAVTVNHHGN